MTYNASEISDASGQPVELYEFTVRELLDVWRYTSAAYDIDYLGNTFEARSGLYRDDIEDDEDAFSSELKVHIPSDDDLARQYLLAAPDFDIDFILYRAHGTDFERYWSGTIHSCYPIDGDEAVIALKDQMGDLERPTQSYKFCRQCPVGLYTDLCGVNKDVYATAGVVQTVSGTSVTATALGYLADGWFNGGWIVANGRRRKIYTHVANDIVLSHQLPGLVAGMPFVAYPGCDHSYAVCVAKYAHGLEYKGFPYIVDNNPWLQRVFK